MFKMSAFFFYFGKLLIKCDLNIYRINRNGQFVFIWSAIVDAGALILSRSIRTSRLTSPSRKNTSDCFLCSYLTKVSLPRVVKATCDPRNLCGLFSNVALWGFFAVKRRYEFLVCKMEICSILHHICFVFAVLI